MWPEGVRHPFDSRAVPWLEKVSDTSSRRAAPSSFGAGVCHLVTAGAYSIPEVQRLVATLVASKPNGKVAEIGTSYGDGAKEIVAALPHGASFVTVELDPERVARAREALAGTPAEVLEGDWRDHLPQRGPFDALFA